VASEEETVPERDGGDHPKKKGKKKLVLVAIVVVVVLGAGYVLTAGKPTKASAKAAAGSTTPTTEAVGPVINLDAITLNLADGHYLKIGIALQLSKTAKTGNFTNNDARTLDATISVFGTKTVPSLAAPGGRDEAKAELAKRVRAVYPSDVVGIYFTDFVMQ
jgi:flagellar FliL protein